MQYQNIPYRTGEIVVMADLHFDTYRRFSVVPNDLWGLQDMVWNADALILAGDLTDGPADRWAQVFQYLSEFISPDRIGAPLPIGIPERDVPILRRDRRLKPRETLRVHQNHRAWLEEGLANQHPCGDQGRTVIATHHGPHPETAGDIDTLSAAFHSNMSDLLVQHRPVTWFFGHSHRRLRARIHGTDVRNVSVGYAGELINESSSYLRETCLWESQPATPNAAGS